MVSNSSISQRMSSASCAEYQERFTSNFSRLRVHAARLIHGALKGNDIAVAVVEDTGLGMVQGTVSPRMVGASA